MKKMKIYLTLLIIVLLQCLIVSWAGAAEPAPNEVILFDGRDYIGDSESFKLPENLPYWGTPVGNKLYGKVSSVRLGSDVGVFLFDPTAYKKNEEDRDYYREHCQYNASDSLWGLSALFLPKSTEMLQCNDFYNAFIIYWKKGFEGFVGAKVAWYEKTGKGLSISGLRRYLRPLFLYPPHTSSHCFDLPDNQYIDVLTIIRPEGSEHKVTAKVFKNNSCSGEGISFPGPYSDKKYFKLEKYTFSKKEPPKSILLTYEGPYNQYHGEAHVKAPPSKEPQWVEEDTDRPGKDYRNFWVMRTDPEICSDACKNDDKCKAYTYVPKGLSGDPSKGRCWLKNGVPQPITREGMVSGVKLSFEHATKEADGSAAKAGGQMHSKVEPGKSGIAMVDDIMSFHLVESKGNHLIFEVDYSAVASHGNIIHLGGWIYDSKGQAINGYKPLSFLAPGISKGKVEIIIDAGEGQFGKEIEFFLFEPNKAPFIKKRFPLNMRLPGATAQPPKTEMVPGYIVASANMTVELDVDRPGKDYKNFDLSAANPNLCREACEKDPKCQAFTYVKPGVQGPKARCWLKHSVPPAKKNSCCVSGVRKTSSGVSPWLKPVQTPKVEMGTGYVTTQKGGQQVDLSGTWNSNIGLVYKISQNGNKISYEDPMMHKPVNGTVDGKTVTVSWAEGNTLKSLKGTITSVGKDGKAKRINWANGVIFQR